MIMLVVFLDKKKILQIGHYSKAKPVNTLIMN